MGLPTWFRAKWAISFSKPRSPVSAGKPIVPEMRGTDAKTGKALTGINHLRQSIRDILTTPLGSRIMRRDYGSRLFDLVDNPLNDATLIEIFAATAEALMLWEPRLQVQRVQASSLSPASISIDLEAIYLPTGEPVFLDGIQVS
jgi:phage baseplate assembly protein W